MYRVGDGAYVRDNGDLIGNRPLYGAASSFRLVAGDRPLFALSLGPDGGKIGSVYIGFAVEGRSRWLHHFSHVRSAYDPGLMRYELEDVQLGVRCMLEAVTMAEGAGGAWRLELNHTPEGCRLVWCLGGASGYHANYYLDPTRWRLSPEDAVANRVQVVAGGAILHAPNLASGYERMTGRFVEHHWPKPVFAYTGAEERTLAVACDLPGEFRVVSAAAAETSPAALWLSAAGDYPVAAFRSNELRAGTVAHIGARVVVGSAEEEALFTAPLGQAFAAGCERVRSVAERLTVTSPHPDLDLASRAMAVAQDGAWVPPSFLHGAWSWMQHYLGWRGWYGADCLGWHERVRQAVGAHLATQFREGPEAGAISDMLERRGVFYNMTEVFLNQVLHHLEWTGDLGLGREVYPSLLALRGWEKRTFDPDNDGLYENAINTWCSDNHWYLGGGCVQASAYNYAANWGLARLARALGEDESAFVGEAMRILAAANRSLWVGQRGCFAEYRDYLGLRRRHEEPELASIYHPIEFGLADFEQAEQMLDYVRRTFQWESLQNGGKLVWSSNWYPVYPNGRQHSTRDLIFAECLNVASAFARVGDAETLQGLLLGAAAAPLAGPMPGGLTCHANPDGSQRVNEDFTDAISMFLRVVVEDLFGIRPALVLSQRLVAPCLPERWDAASLKTRGHELDWRRDGHWRLLDLRADIPARTTMELPLGNGELEAIEVSDPRAEAAGQHRPGRSVATVRFRGSDLQVRARVGAPTWQVIWPARWVEGESVAIQAEGAAIQSVRDPGGVLTDLSFAGGGVTARVARATPGTRLYVRLSAEGRSSFWDCIRMASIAPIESRLLDAGPGGEWTLALRNNGAAGVGVSVVIGGHFSGEWRGTLPPLGERLLSLAPAGPLLPGLQRLQLRIMGDVMVEETLLAHRWELGSPIAGQWRSVDLTPWRDCLLEEVLATLDVMATAVPYTLSQRYMRGVEFDDRPISCDTLRASADEAGYMTVGPGLRFDLGSPPSLAVRLSRWRGQRARLDVPLSGTGRAVYMLLAALTTAMQSHITNAVATVQYKDGECETLELVNPTNLDSGLGRFGPYHYGEGLPVPVGRRIETDEAVASTAHAPDARDTNRPPLPVTMLGVETHADAYCIPLQPGRPLRRFSLEVLSNEVVLALLGLSLLSLREAP
ncbi:MAG: DUF4450 domain-containing protein [Anaerolineae bacterium]|nr:DUF4450 domain-containing protein [Anaerolineae bacterium]